MKKHLFICIALLAFALEARAQVVSTDPQTRYRDSDTAIDNGGLMRQRFNGGVFALESNTNALGTFGTVVAPFQITVPSTNYGDSTQSNVVRIAGPIVKGSNYLGTGSIYLAGDSAESIILGTASSADPSDASILAMRRYRGTQSARTNAANGDVMGWLSFQGYANHMYDSAGIQGVVDGAVSNNVQPPSRLNFYTLASGESWDGLAWKMSLRNNGDLELSDGTMIVGESTNASAFGAHAVFIGADDYAFSVLHAASNTAAVAGNVYLARSRGTHAARLKVANGDTVGQIASAGDAADGGGSLLDMAYIRFRVDGTYTAGQRPPSRIEFYTSTANAAYGAPNMTLTSEGGVTMPEQANVTAPAANSGTYYFRDDGAGKTQFVVLFPTGSVQVLATEP
jgi:hypothetical protein